MMPVCDMIRVPLTAVPGGTGGGPAMMPVWLAGAGDGDGVPVCASRILVLVRRLLVLLRAGA